MPMTSRKAKLIGLTALSAVLTVVAATQLRGVQDASRTVVLGWGFILIFGCVFFVRGIYAITRCK